MSSEDKLAGWLFETHALRVSPQDKPFWYTSGTIGPYYINTHFLYGSEEKANALLAYIDRIKEDVLGCPEKILQVLLENYAQDAVYKGLIDEMCSFIRNNLDLEEIGYISGGERRDWFFSPIVAHFLNKSHITIYKNLTSVVSFNGQTHQVSDLGEASVLHIADLITEASSYERAWIPALKSLNATMRWSLVVVDRKQGGAELLKQHGVESHSMVQIDQRLFDKVLSMAIIDEGQHRLILDYIEDPKEAMQRFLRQHPEFLQNALAADDKTRQRALLCLEKNFYAI